ncbi:sugar kinase [Kurthia sibirica]|uniref:2-keto-3-deoxygluconate kinase n=1 Tax=Kurthia sibirica TaxID=202750 RepID=A0A2U3AI10_9BACL|nr:sugar kinase [Kurthia sibirica]PWI24189.1 2-keto-3-deoxygluconate kinase [Kurthia sibirica]GEK34809.1 sugar kinase [Kurthia sibirica]
MNVKQLDIITIGDGMITFDPIAKGPLRFVNHFERKIGGAELNVMIGCARLGMKSGWISRLGRDEFGRHIINTIRGEGIDVSEVQLVENYATSLNFKEIHESGKARTFYYRQKSPTETLTIDQLPIDYIQSAKIIHLSGVFPSIRQQNREVLFQTLKIAHTSGVKVSFDPNIRLKLWSKEEARQTILTYLPYVDYLLAGREELEIIFNTTDMTIILELLKKYAFEQVILKDGASGASYLSHGQWVHVPGEKVDKVVDTVGAGDGFSAAFLCGILKGWHIDKIMKFANAVGAMVVQVQGDNEGLPYYEDVEVYLGLRENIER